MEPGDAGAQAEQQPGPKRVKLNAGPPQAAAAAEPPKRPNYLCSAHDAVTLRLVYASRPDELEREISAGGTAFKAEFLHQHFGDDEVIKGFNDLRITVWFHAQTYVAWVQIAYGSRRPGADKLASIFEENFPAGFCSSREDFVKQVATAVAGLPDLFDGPGDTVGAVPVPAGGADTAGEIRIRRFRLGEGGDPAVRVGGRRPGVGPHHTTLPQGFNVCGGEGGGRRRTGVAVRGGGTGRGNDTATTSQRPSVPQPPPPPL